MSADESVEVDLHRYRDLARASVPVGVMSAGPRGEPASPRLHEILRPAGFTSELRLALCSRTRLWGALVLFRADRSRPFTDQDAELSLDLADPLAAAVRRYPVRSTPFAVAPRLPGVVLLDETNSIVSMTAEARVWLDDVRGGGLDEVDSDDVLRVVYDVGLAAQAVAGSTAAAPLCRLRTTSGRWLLIHGSRLENDPTSVAVTLQPATLRHLLPAAAAWFGFTGRESEVLRLVALGMPAKHMSRELRLSVLTVNDHLRAIYRKAGVSGREELLARLT